MMFEPPFCHWYESVPESDAVADTEKVTDWPTILATDTGCVPIVGETADATDEKENVAVDVPDVFVAVIVYVVELAVVLGVPESNPVEVLNESVPLELRDGEIE